MVSELFRKQEIPMISWTQFVKVMASEAWASLSIKFDDFLKRFYKGNASLKNVNYQKWHRFLFLSCFMKIHFGAIWWPGILCGRQAAWILKMKIEKWDRFLFKAALWRFTSGRFRDQGYFVVARLITNVFLLHTV